MKLANKDTFWPSFSLKIIIFLLSRNNLILLSMFFYLKCIFYVTFYLKAFVLLGLKRFENKCINNELGYCVSSTVILLLM